jgi:hypothetical protein
MCDAYSKARNVYALVGMLMMNDWCIYKCISAYGHDGYAYGMIVDSE